MKKKKLLLFQSKIMPYRVDMFNFLAKNFNAKFIFFNKKLESKEVRKYGLIQPKNYEKKLNMNKQYLLNGLSLFNKDIFRFGIFKNLRSFDPDIVITYEYSLSTISSIIFKKIFKRKYKIFVMTDENIYSFNKRKGFRYLVLLIIIKLIDGMILANKNVKSKFIKITNNKFSFLYNPIIQDEKKFRIELKKSVKLSKKNFYKYKLDKKKIVLFVGRFSSEKRIEDLIKNFSKINDPSLRLFLIGQGAQYKFLKKLSIRLQCSQRIFFLGKQEDIKLYSWYNIAQLFILPSSSELFGAVVNEALLSGLKVICSNRAGASVLINRSNGIIFDFKKRRDLFVSMKKMVKKINHLSIKDLKSTKKNLMPYSFNSINSELLKGLNK